MPSSETGAAAEAPPADVLLVAAAAEVEARAAAPAAALVHDHTTAALDAYCRISYFYPDLDDAARDVMQPLALRVLRDAASARDLMREDPGAPGLEAQHYFLLSELGNLAAVFAAPYPGPPEAQGPRGARDPHSGAPGPFPAGAADHAGVYESICEEIGAGMAAAQDARPVWQLVRETPVLPNPGAAARSRPPPRRPPRSPLADDEEYYGS